MSSQSSSSSFLTQAFSQELYPVRWVGSSKKNLRAMPKAARQCIGSAIWIAQCGSTHRNTKPWKGAGSGVFEVACNVVGDAFRAAYATRFTALIYVLHCFTKKSPSGIKTARTDIALIERRLTMAEQDFKVRNEQAKH